MFGNNGFPIIKHIDDVLPYIEGRSDFAVKRREGYTAIDYIFAGEDTFDEPIRRECRGIKFGSDGKIIARPFHKFFNLGEKPETQLDAIDWDAPYVVLEKYDGSMVHPARVGDDLLWMTRAGVTDISLAAADFASRDPRFIATCNIMVSDGLTPIFEWTSPINQIVLRYPSDRLVLIGVRHMETGRYQKLRGQPFEDVADDTKENHSIGAMVEHTRALKDKEGYVLRFPSGSMLKIKADDYVTRHKARDSILLEKNVLRIILEGAADDVIPLLAPEDADRLRTYQAGVGKALAREANGIEKIVIFAKSMIGEDRKRFALEVAAQAPAIWKAPLFATWSGASAAESVRLAMLKHCGSQTDVDALRNAMNLPQWQTPTMMEAA